MEMGVPVVFPSNTPERISTESLSMRLVVYLLCPGLRLSRNACISFSVSGSPAGQPSITTPTAAPWDSPHVVIRNILPNDEPLMSSPPEKNNRYCDEFLQSFVSGYYKRRNHAVQEKVSRRLPLPPSSENGKRLFLRNNSLYI